MPKSLCERSEGETWGIVGSLAAVTKVELHYHRHTHTHTHTPRPLYILVKKGASSSSSPAFNI